MLKVHNFNFYAGEQLSKGALLTADATNTDGMHIAVKEFDDDGLVGVCNSDCNAGDVVDFIKIEAGQVIHIIAPGTATKGSQIGTLPFIALEAGSEGDLIEVICIAG